MGVQADNHEVAILNRVLPPRGVLSAAAARAWLKLDFPDQDQRRMHALALKAQQGSLGRREEIELDSYRRVGRLLELMHSKARRSLRKRRSTD